MESKAKSKIAIVHLGFALTGIVTTMLGPLLPLLVAQWHLDDAQAGRIFWAQFISSPTGALIASKVLSRWGASWTVPIGMILIAAGVTTIGLGTFPLVITGITIYGLGLGFALPSTNLLIVEMVSARQASALNILNFCWSVGALAGPVVLSAMLKPFGLRGFLFSLGAAALVIGLIEAVAFPKGTIVSASTRHGKIAHSSRVSFAIVSFFFLFIYVGIENGFSGWVPLFSMRSQHIAESTTALVQSSFWAALLIGRLTAPISLRLMREGTLILASLVLATAGMLVAILSPTIAVLELGVILAGLGLAAIFPTAMAVFAQWYGTGGAGSIVLGLCGLGGAVVPWLVGVVSDRSQNLRLGLTVSLACCAIAALLYWRMDALAHDPQGQAASVN